MAEKMELSLPSAPFFQRFFTRWQKSPDTAFIRDLSNNIEVTIGEFLYDVLKAKDEIYDMLDEKTKQDLADSDPDRDVFFVVLAEAGYGFWVVVFAVYAFGGVVVPLSPHILQEEATYYLNICNAKLLLTTPRLHPHAESISTTSAIPLYTFTHQQPPSTPTFALSSSPPVPETTGFLLIYTSGTTGTPKGVLHSRHSAEIGASYRADLLNFSPGQYKATCTLHYTPLHWAGGFHNALIALISGPCVEFCRDVFTPSYLLTRVAKGDVRMMTATSAFLDTIATKIAEAENTLSKEEYHDMINGFCAIEMISSGGMRMNPHVRDTWMKQRRGKPVHIVYAMTETLSAVAMRGEGEDALPDCVGQVTPNVTLKISPTGEICIKGPVLFKRYISADPNIMNNIFDEDGFYKTGDLGKVENGLLFVHGRASHDVIRFNGWKISAPEVEDELSRHAHITKAVVVGVSDPNCGQRVAALISTTANTTSESVNLADLRRWLVEQGLSAYKLPTLLRVIQGDEEIPLTISGKPIKPRIRDGFFGEDEIESGRVEVWDLSLKMGMGEMRPFDWAGIQAE